MWVVVWLVVVIGRGRRGRARRHRSRQRPAPGGRAGESAAVSIRALILPPVVSGRRRRRRGGSTGLEANGGPRRGGGDRCSPTRAHAGRCSDREQMDGQQPRRDPRPARSGECALPATRRRARRQLERESEEERRLCEQPGQFARVDQPLEMLLRHECTDRQERETARRAAPRRRAWPRARRRRAWRGRPGAAARGRGRRGVAQAPHPSARYAIACAEERPGRCEHEREEPGQNVPHDRMMPVCAAQSVASTDSRPRGCGQPTLSTAKPLESEGCGQRLRGRTCRSADGRRSSGYASSFARTSSLTTRALAFPWVSFITWPTKKPSRPALPFR